MKLIVTENLSDELVRTVSALHKLAFRDISDQEAEEDFYNPEVAHVLAYVEDELVGWAGIHQANVAYMGRHIKLGGFGTCTHPGWQGKGVASKVSQEAMRFLKSQGCDVAFLSVDPSNQASARLHQKTGFVNLPGKFTWTNVYGENKEADGGMIAPLNSRGLFEHSFGGGDVFHVGNGYW